MRGRVLWGKVTEKNLTKLICARMQGARKGRGVRTVKKKKDKPESQTNVIQSTAEKEKIEKGREPEIFVETQKRAEGQTKKKGGVHLTKNRGWIKVRSKGKNLSKIQLSWGRSTTKE